jgi:tetratricopeptide (TPR) repeat protein
MEEALAIRRKHPYPHLTAASLCNLGVTLAFAGNLDRAKTCYQEAFDLSHQSGDAHGAAQLAANLATTALDQGDLGEAKRWASEALQRLRSIGQGLDTSSVLSTLATIAREEGDVRAARSRDLEVVSIAVERRDRLWLARSILGLACSSVMENDWERAARLFGAGEAQTAALGNVIDPGLAARTERYVGVAREHLGPDRFADLHALGRGLSLEQALTLAGAGDALGLLRA